MSKNQVFEFFALAAKNEAIGREVRSSTDPERLLKIAEAEGFHFSRRELDEALRELNERPNFFQKLARAVLEVFSPNPDEPPTIGVQPYQGEIGRTKG